MKNKKRKIVSLALAAIMAFSAFYTSGGLSFADETEKIRKSSSIRILSAGKLNAPSVKNKNKTPFLITNVK